MLNADRPASFPVLLRRYRTAAGLSQDELARRAGLGRRAISDLERARRDSPDPGTVRRLIAALRLGRAQRTALLASARRQPVETKRREPADPATSVAPVEIERKRSHNLPTQLTSFIGRVQETADVRSELRRSRLLTLTGPGGVGKTRLALRVAEEEVETFPDGAWFIDLEGLHDEALVPDAVARTLGLRERPSEPVTTTLQRAIGQRRLLLIMDNCEHLRLRLRRAG